MRNLRAYLIVVAALVSVPVSAQTRPADQSRPGTGTLTVSAPLFLLPDATRTPLTTIPAGTVVRVLARQGDWYQVVFRDAIYGDRTGYVRAASIRVDAAPQPAAPAASLPASAAPPAKPAATPPKRPAPRFRLAPWADHGDLWVNGLYQSTSDAFSATTSLTRNVETGSITTSYSGGHPVVLDISGRGIVARHVALGAAVTWLSKSTTADVSASLPHPFFFNAFRQVSGAADGLSREEFALHLDVSGLVPIGRVMQLAVFGGPSFVNVRQDLVTDVIVTEAYPYDTAAFVAATANSASKAGVGYNVGLDLSARVAHRIGVGFTARYSDATVHLPANTAGQVTVHAGGLQIGGGVRFGF